MSNRSLSKACLFGGTLFACGLTNTADAQFEFSSSYAYVVAFNFSNNISDYSYFSGAGFWSATASAPGALSTGEATVLQFRMAASVDPFNFAYCDTGFANFTVATNVTATATWDYSDPDTFGGWTIVNLTDSLTLLSVGPGTSGSVPITFEAGKSYSTQGLVGAGGANDVDGSSTFAQLVIPAPGGAALLGVGAVASLRRRR